MLHTFLLSSHAVRQFKSVFGSFGSFYVPPENVRAAAYNTIIMRNVVLETYFWMHSEERAISRETLGNRRENVFCVLTRVNEPVQNIGITGAFCYLE